MKKIKILHAIRQGLFGGGESHVLELASNLDCEQFESVVLSFTPGPMVDELNRRGIRTKVIHTERGFDFNIWEQVTDFIRNEKFDLIHAHGTRANSNVFRSAKKLRIPLVYTVHGWSFHPDQNCLVRKLRELSEKFLTNMADKTICVSKSNQQDGIERFAMPRSTVIYNAVDLHKFDAHIPQPDLRKEFGIAANAKVIGYIVRMTKQKDPFTMLKAMQLVSREIPESVLLMVGEGELKSEAIQLAEKLGISDRVIFHPFRSDIPAVLKAIDVYCLPSLWEGFPIGILEAMAMNKPVVASPVDGTRELIGNGQTGILVENGNPGLLGESLIELLKNVDLQKVLAANAYKFVCENFGIERLVAQLQVVYEKMVSKTNS